MITSSRIPDYEYLILLQQLSTTDDVINRMEGLLVNMEE